MANKNSVQQSTAEVSHPTDISIKIPTSLKWTVIVGVVLMTLATIGNLAYSVWKGETVPTSVVQTDELANDSISLPVSTQVADSISLKNQQNVIIK